MTITIDFFPSGALRAVPLTGTVATLSLAIAFAAMVTESARAQTYPARPITMVVGYGVGGPSDTIARIVADRMKSVLGQPIVVENVTGAAGSLGLGRLARATPDGYTIGLGDWSTLCVNGAIYNLPYNVVKDFAPISMLPSAPQIIVTKSVVPTKILTELLAWLKANQSKVSYGTSGVGSPSHVSGVLLQNITGAKFQLVPYRGAAQVMTDMISGQIDLSMFPATVALQQLRAGNARGLCRHSQNSSSCGPRNSNRGRGGPTGLLHFPVVWAVGTQGRTQRRRRCDAVA